jgi:hypothetical protein
MAASHVLYSFGDEVPEGYIENKSVYWPSLGEITKPRFIELLKALPQGHDIIIHRDPAGYTIDITRATVRAMYGVLPHFPGLRFIMPHHGGAAPFLKGRIQMFFKPEGVEIPDHLKLLPLSPIERDQLGFDAPFEELFGKVFFDTAGFGG